MLGKNPFHGWQQVIGVLPCGTVSAFIIEGIVDVAVRDNQGSSLLINFCLGVGAVQGLPQYLGTILFQPVKYFCHAWGGTWVASSGYGPNVLCA